MCCRTGNDDRGAEQPWALPAVALNGTGRALLGVCGQGVWRPVAGSGDVGAPVFQILRLLAPTPPYTFKGVSTTTRCVPICMDYLSTSAVARDWTYARVRKLPEIQKCQRASEEPCASGFDSCTSKATASKILPQSSNPHVAPSASACVRLTLRPGSTARRK